MATSASRLRASALSLTALAFLAVALSLALSAYASPGASDREAGGQLGDVSGANPCSPIMSVLNSEPSGNELANSGLLDAGLPAGFVQDLHVGSLTCLSTGMEDRVRAVVVELFAGGEESAALWLLHHPEDADEARWQEYLTDIAPWDVGEFVSDRDSLVAVPATERAHEVDSGSQDRITMWQMIMSAQSGSRE